MRRFLSLALPVASIGLIGCHPTHASPFPNASAAPDTTLMGADIRRLASDAMEGRLTGTAGNDSAALYIANRYQLLGLAVLTTPAVSLDRQSAEARAASRWGIPSSASCFGSAARLSLKVALGRRG